MASKALSRKVTIYINGKEVESTLHSLKSEMDKDWRPLYVKPHLSKLSFFVV